MWCRRRSGAGTDGNVTPAEGMFDHGLKAYKGGDRAAARDWFRRAADLGYAHAMFDLALMAGEDGNRASARDWFRRAADLGHGEADRKSVV